MKRYALILRLAVLCSVFLVISDVSAQFGGGGGGFGGGRSGGKSGRGGDSQGGNNSSRSERQVAQPETNSYEQIEYRLALFEEDLKLKPEQNDKWQSFAKMTLAYAGDLARERARSMRSTSSGDAPTNALQHVRETVDAAQNRLAALQDVESSTRAFYQTLTSEQKTLADSRIPTIIAPRPMAPVGNNAGSNLPDLGSSSRQSR
jgi:hypothetical protein